MDVGLVSDFRVGLLLCVCLCRETTLEDQLRAIISGQELNDCPVNTTLRQHSPTVVSWDNEGGDGLQDGLAREERVGGGGRKRK